MTTFIYSTHFEESTTWLLDEEQLAALDDVIDAELTRLSERARRDAGEAEPLGYFGDSVHSRLKPNLAGQVKTSRQVTLTLAGGHKLDAATFAEAARHHELRDRTATGATVEVQFGRSELVLKIDRDFSRFSLNAMPETSDDARDLFSAVFGWSRRAAAPLWIRRWSFPVALVAWGVFSFIAVMLMTHAASSAGNRYRAEASALLKKGLTPADQTKALEILLGLETAGWDVNMKLTPPSGRELAILIAASVAALMLSIYPKTTIGIGHGASVVARWRLWSRFVVITIPGFVFMNLIWPILQPILLR